MADDPGAAQCLFCSIVAGSIPAKKVYEDEKCVAILDINPANVGHVLLLPREHFSIMPQVPLDDIAHVGMVSKQLSQAMVRALKDENVGGTSIVVANGPAAGQRAMHFMMHIIPRIAKDGVGLLLPQGRMREEDVAKLREVLAPAIAQAFGLPAPKAPQPEAAPEPPAEQAVAEEAEAEDELSEEEQKRRTLDDIAGFLVKK